MWEPEPGWVRLPAGAGPSTYGVWRASLQGRDVVVKRLVAPGPHDPPELSTPRHFAYWRRPVEAALSGDLDTGPGLRAVPLVSVDEDAEGVTLVSASVEATDAPGLFLARALGRFAAGPRPDRPWLARRQLADRLARVAARGGWTALARTTVADVADHLWRRREVLLASLDQLPQVPQHGDPTPANLPGRHGDDVVALDWATYGVGPVGGDLGYLSLGVREDLDPLLDAYLDALPPGLADREQVAQGARVVAVLTCLTRADWALARVAEGEGPLAGKFTHPSVAPSLRTLQRQAPQIEALLGPA